MEECKSDHKWYETQLKEEEKKENDILHELEGVSTFDKCPPKCDERSRLATQLQNTLISRRIAKDNIILNQPIADFLVSEYGKDMINKLKQKLGEVRKIESNMSTRRYYKRVEEKPVNDVDKDRRLDKLIRDWKRNSKHK